MQKQLKNLKYKHKNLLKPQDLRKLKSLFRNKPQVFNTVFTNLFKRERQQRKLKIIIKLTPNNIFCTLVNFPLNKNLLTKSAGSYKMNISKKKIHEKLEYLLYLQVCLVFFLVIRLLS